MSKWSYRIVKVDMPQGNMTDDYYKKYILKEGPWYGLYEVYYDDDLKPSSRAAECILGPYSTSEGAPKNIREVLKMMLKDCSLPVLDDNKHFPDV